MYDHAHLAQLIAQMASAIEQRRLHDPVLIGIHSGGAWVAEQLHAAMPTAPLGALDISFYRDDFSRVGLNPKVKASDFPAALDERDLVLIDDVLHTGRTIRAALNEIFSYGRPERVCLAVLIERPGRELPIQADIVGQSLQLSAHQQAKLSRNDGKLALHIIDTADANRAP